MTRERSIARIWLSVGVVGVVLAGPAGVLEEACSQPFPVAPALRQGLKELPSVADRPKVAAPAVLVKTIFTRLEFAPQNFCDVNLHLVFVPGKQLDKFTIPARFFGHGSEVKNDQGAKPVHTIPQADILEVDAQGHVCRVRVGDATFRVIVHEKKTITRK